MGWSDWFSSSDGEASSKDVEPDESRSGNVETHYISTAGSGTHHSGGGDRDNHNHVVVQHKPDGTKSAHCVPHKQNR